MIKIFKKIIELKLRFYAKLVLKKYKPDIIGITGSVGKTSAKEAIYAVLSSKFKVRKNIKNYNNEIGVPLSILGPESGYKNVFIWLGIFIKAWLLILFRQKDYPQVLVLEMGADKPGDIKYLIDFAPCKIGVVTAIAPVHLEFFKTMERIVKEKQIIVSHLKQDEFAILNGDDTEVLKMKEKTKAKVLTFGFKNDVDIKAFEPNIMKGGAESKWVDYSIQGISFKVAYQGANVPFFLNAVFGEHQVLAALAAIGCGIAYKMNMVEISEALKKYVSPAGRMKLIPGIKHTFIIDDSYNSSPSACLAALDVVKKIEIDGEKYAAFGEMAELGDYTEQGHREVGRAAAKLINYLITVGEKTKYIADEAVKSGMDKDHVFSFDYNDEAGEFIKNRIKTGDLILVKGSQVSRMERVVEELMAEPEDAEKHLVRQGSEWNV